MSRALASRRQPSCRCRSLRSNHCFKMHAFEAYGFGPPYIMSASGSEGSARSKVALITGITGQDGSYLAELLLQKVSLKLPSSLIFCVDRSHLTTQTPVLLILLSGL